MKIRKIKESDLATCTKILEDAYSLEPYNETFVKPNAENYIRRKYNCCKENSFVAMDADGNVVAFIFLNISSWSNGLQAVLEEIAVDSRFQRVGIGSQLLEYAHNHIGLLGVKSAMLWVKNDERLLNFYNKRGYALADDFVVMFKNF